MTSKPRTPRKSAQSTRKSPAGESAENTFAEPTKKAQTKPDQGDRYMRGRRVWPD